MKQPNKVAMIYQQARSKLNYTNNSYQQIFTPNLNLNPYLNKYITLPDIDFKYLFAHFEPYPLKDHPVTHKQNNLTVLRSSCTLCQFVFIALTVKNQWCRSGPEGLTQWQQILLHLQFYYNNCSLWQWKENWHRHLLVLNSNENNFSTEIVILKLLVTRLEPKI